MSTESSSLSHLLDTNDPPLDSEPTTLRLLLLLFLPTTCHCSDFSHLRPSSLSQKLLETTQLSRTAIVHFIHWLRAWNRSIRVQEARSEFRVSERDLGLGIVHLEIDNMEREFLAGCDYALSLSYKVYEDWGRLLKGLTTPSGPTTSSSDPHDLIQFKTSDGCYDDDDEQPTGYTQRPVDLTAEAEVGL
ncbi:hypothetical protein C8F01DRAFT_1264496 [Mycena amicta]|nr:hypothetical protein C8F01DRAFT_1264496 [Mycena amicta]